MAESERDDEAERFAHSVKGSARNIEAGMLREKAGDLEKWYSKGNKGLPQAQYEEFAAEIEIVMDSLSKLEMPARGMAQEEPSLGPMTETEKAAIISKVSNLLGLARSNDTRVTEKMEELLAAINGKVESEKLSEAQRLIDEWDFESAAELLSSVLSDLT